MLRYVSILIGACFASGVIACTSKSSHDVSTSGPDAAGASGAAEDTSQPTNVSGGTSGALTGGLGGSGGDSDIESTSGSGGTAGTGGGAGGTGGSASGTGGTEGGAGGTEGSMGGTEGSMGGTGGSTSGTGGGAGGTEGSPGGTGGSTNGTGGSLGTGGGTGGTGTGGGTGGSGGGGEVTYRCSGNDSEILDENGDYVLAQTCEGETPFCIEATGRCGACLEDDAVCLDGATLGVCDALGTYVPDDCDSDTPTCFQDECTECSPEADTYRCAAGNSQLCDETGNWVATLCEGETPVCIEATGRCGTCLLGERQCRDADTYEVCDDMSTFVPTNCPAATPACWDSECFECNPSVNGGDPVYDCAGNTPRVCSGGSWVNQTPCSGTEPICNPDTGQCQCDPGDYDCDGAELLLCSDAGVWTTESTCSGNRPVCDASQGRCECTEGNQICGGDATTRECVNGQWVDTDCTGSQVCWQGDCVACNPDDFERRDGTTPCGLNGVFAQDCVAGVWQNTSECVPCRRDLTFPDSTVDWWVRGAIGAQPSDPIPWNGPILDVTSLMIWGSPPPADAAGLECVSNLESLFFSGGENELANPQSLAALTKLETLTVEYLGINLFPLEGALPSLKYLTLYTTDLGSADIEPIASFTGLESLDLSNNTSLNNLNHLSGLSNLEVLYVPNCNLSTLEPIFDLPSLIELNVQDNNVSICDELSNFSGVTIFDSCP